MTDGWHRNQVERGIQQISREKWKSLIDFGKSRTAELAVEYLASPSGWHRETGAMIVGQVRIRDAIPRLQVLASGDAAYLSRIDETNRRRKLYFVRRAAANALVAMAEEPPKGAVFEEVTPEVAEPAIEWWWHDTTTSGSRRCGRRSTPVTRVGKIVGRCAVPREEQRDRPQADGREGSADGK